MAGKLKRNLAIGFLGGLAGTAAMNAYWKGLAKANPLLGGKGETRRGFLRRAA